MHKKCVIAIDGQGGDHAPKSICEGIRLFVNNNQFGDVFFNIFGNENEIKKQMLGMDKSLYKIFHTEKSIAMDEMVQHGVRHSSNTSMRMAIESVRDGLSHGCLSGGNTAVLMALSKIILKTSGFIDRPAICAMIPTQTNRSVLLDMGANIDVTGQNLFEFAIMGSIFSHLVLNVESPKIGLLNIGSEDTKGHPFIMDAANILKEKMSEQFIGYIEPHELYSGKADVIVADGFTGNVVIKSAEGLGRFVKSLLKEAFTANYKSKAGYLMSKDAIQNTMSTIDPNNYNGGMFIGLNGISVKSHGGADKYGFENAIKVTQSIINNRINDKIKDAIEHYSIKS